MPYSQDQINSGQSRINYELVEVDKKVIWALRDILAIIKDVAGAPTVAPHLSTVDFRRLESALEVAYAASVKVADIKPPGCEGPPLYPN